VKRLILFSCICALCAVTSAQVKSVLVRKAGTSTPPAGGTRTGSNITVRDTARYETVYNDTRTVSLTVSSTTNRYALVFVTIGDAATVTGIARNSQNFVFKGYSTRQETQRVEIWGLTAPTTGTNDLVVTTSGACYLGFSVVVLSGVDQTTPTADTVSAIGYANSVSDNISSSSEYAVFDIAANWDTGTWTEGAGQTRVMRWDANQPVIVTRETGSATTTMSNTCTTTGYVFHALIEVWAASE
jgi:hypothetical protein